MKNASQRTHSLASSSIAPQARRGRCFSLALALGLAVFGCAQATEPSPLQPLQQRQPGRAPVQLMVLGTVHLKPLGEALQPAMLAPLLDVLAGFKPDVIAIEALPGERVHELLLRRGANEVHDELIDGYAGLHQTLAAPAQPQLGLDALQARRALEALDGEADPGRRILLQLAAYEPFNALLGWSRLDAQQRARAGLPADLTARLDKQLQRRDETVMIGLELARRLGLRELAAVDEFEDTRVFGPLSGRLAAALATHPLVAAVARAPVYVEQEKLQRSGLAQGDLLPLYRAINAGDRQRDDVDAQWGIFLRTGLSDGSDRGRLALWEERNLKIAARLRALTARYIGKRVLVVYGAAHKPFLDAYLAALGDIDVVQPSSLPGWSQGSQGVRSLISPPHPARPPTSPAPRSGG